MPDRQTLPEPLQFQVDPATHIYSVGCLQTMSLPVENFVSSLLPDPGGAPHHEAVPDLRFRQIDLCYGVSDDEPFHTLSSRKRYHLGDPPPGQCAIDLPLLG